VNWSTCVFAFLGLSGLALAACGGKGEDSGDGLPPADLAGEYNVTVIGTAGCEGRSDLLDAWARGPLRVSGEGSNLSWDFGADVLFAGEVDADGRFRFGGDWSQGADTGTLSASGILGFEGTLRVLEGDLSLTLAEEPPCTIEGPFEAVELVVSEG
jgi:hypothetical protein